MRIAWTHHAQQEFQSFFLPETIMNPVAALLRHEGIVVHQSIEYKGCVILPITTSTTFETDSESMYRGGYEISKDGKTLRVRRNLFPKFFYIDAAVTDSIEYAKLEIDNLVSTPSP